MAGYSEVAPKSARSWAIQSLRGLHDEWYINSNACNPQQGERGGVKVPVLGGDKGRGEGEMIEVWCVLP